MCSWAHSTLPHSLSSKSLLHGPQLSSPQAQKHIICYTVYRLQRLKLVFWPMAYVNPCPLEKGHKAICHWQEQKQSRQRQGLISAQASHITLTSRGLWTSLSIWQKWNKGIFPFQEPAAGRTHGRSP